MNYFVSVEGEQFEIEVNGTELKIDGEVVDVDLAGLPGTSRRSLLLDGRSHAIAAEGRGGGVWVLDLDVGPVRVEVVDRAGLAIRELTRRVAAERGPRPLRAPMPGMVVKVEVEEGEVVGAGQAVVVVEAMKMENELSAEAEGRVKKVHVAPGEPVEKDQVLIEFGPVDDEETSDA